MKQQTKVLEIPEVVESMAVASARWGISTPVLRAAKKAGCPAFVAHRIHRTPLMAWLKSNPEVAGEGEKSATKAALEIRKLAAQVDQLELKLAREKGELVEKALVTKEWARAMAIIQEEAKSLMERDHYAVFITRIKARIREYSEEQPQPTN